MLALSSFRPGGPDPADGINCPTRLLASTVYPILASAGRFVVLEYFPIGSLNRLLAKVGRLEIEQCWALFEDLLRALGAAHEILLATESREGTFLGEVAALTGGTRTATMKAETEVIAHALNASQLEQPVTGNPAIGIRLIRSMAERLGRES